MASLFITFVSPFSYLRFGMIKIMAMTISAINNISNLFRFLFVSLSTKRLFNADSKNNEIITIKNVIMFLCSSYFD